MFIKLSSIIEVHADLFARINLQSTSMILHEKSFFLLDRGHFLEDDEERLVHSKITFSFINLRNISNGISFLYE